MQPIVRPGLFDNGRTSKDQLPDLTFHEMHFLKKPVPQKPILRDRERAKKRGERDLEEVSAFFQHKGFTEVPGASSRYHPRASDSSSPDRATRGSAALSIDAPLHQSRSGEPYGHASPDIDKESSRATDWTWSSSSAAPGRRTAQTSGAREHVPEPNSTPSSSRHAMRRKEKIENKGLDCIKRSSKVLSAPSRSNRDWKTIEPRAVVSSDIVSRQPDMSMQNIRIVRYHDRGVMASDEAGIVPGHPQRGIGARLDAVEQTRLKSPAGSPNPLSVAKCSRVRPEDERVNLTHGEGELCKATTLHAASHDSGPGRPRSPKCTLIERLEAAVENFESQELQSDLLRGLAPLPVHGDGQAAPARYNNNIQGAHSHFQDACSKIEPRFFGDSHKDQFEAVHKDESFYTSDGKMRCSQQTHEVDLAPRMAPNQMSIDSRWFGNLDQPARGVRSAHREPSSADPTACYTLGNPSGAQMISPFTEPGPQTVMVDLAAPGNGQHASDQFFHRSQTMLSQAAGVSSRVSDRQKSLEEYIHRMESEVFCRPQDTADDSSIPGWHGMRDDNEFCQEFDPPEHELHADPQDQDLPADGHVEDESIGGRYVGSVNAIQDSDFDQEEQKFMSTFWRPNYY